MKIAERIGFFVAGFVVGTLVTRHKRTSCVAPSKCDICNPSLQPVIRTETLCESHRIQYEAAVRASAACGDARNAED